MTPPLLRRSCTLLAAASLALSLLAGCDRAADEEDAAPSNRQAESTPSPTPAAPSRQERRVLGAYNSISSYLKEQDPALRTHLQKAASKFVQDKDKWRERLQNRQQALGPKIARLREQLAKADGQSAETLRTCKQELAGLEAQRADAEHKLSQLESITNDTWKSFRDGLASEETPAAPPTPGGR